MTLENVECKMKPKTKRESQKRNRIPKLKNHYDVIFRVRLYFSS